MYDDDAMENKHIHVKNINYTSGFIHVHSSPQGKQKSSGTHEGDKYAYYSLVVGTMSCRDAYCRRNK